MLKLLILSALALVQLGVAVPVPAVPVPAVPRDVLPPPLHLGKPLKEVVFDPDSKQQPWEQSGLFEGDILLVDDSARNGAMRGRWPNKTMPYYIDPIFSAKQVAVIQSAIDEYNSRTCVTMKPREDSDKDYVWIRGDKSGCYSVLAYVGGPQRVNLNPSGCVYKSGVLHELLHAWGFWHQQNAVERDEFVTIHYENIKEGHEGNFKNISTMNFGVPYDYGSIMHYGAYAFSKNNKPTIVPLQDVEIGKAKDLSSSDILKLERMYGCQ